MFEVPILFLVFNRPSTTKLVFEQIRSLKPKFLYVAADGPRDSVASDRDNCEQVRAICNNIDWDCQLQTLYRPSNLGCRVAVSTGIDWFFNNVEEGIILEDDILADPSFFVFCERLLSLYRNDPRVMHISGFNIAGKWKSEKQSWHFSYFGGIWGWASWRRSWALYDREISQWKKPDVQQKILTKYFPIELRIQRKDLYDKLSRNEIDTWDYQWTFSKFLHDGLSAVPAVNLVRNIGFNENATHAASAPSWIQTEMHKLDISKDTPEIAVDKKYDSLYLQRTSTYLPTIKNVVLKVKRFLRSLT